MATHILIVEDNPGDARLIGIMLDESDEAFSHQTVATMADAVQALDCADYGVVLLDLSLPDSHGLETVHSLRLHCTDTAVVVLTGVDDTELGVEALQAGAQDYLVKDATDTQVLTRAIRYAIGRAETELAERQQRQLAQALLEIGTLVTSTLDLEEVIKRVLMSLDRIVANAASVFCVIANNKVEAVYTLQQAGTLQMVADNTPFSIEVDSFLDTILTKREMCVALDGEVNLPTISPSYKQCIGLPIIENEAVASILMICIPREQEISKGLQHRLLMFSQQAAIALANAHRFDQSSELAMVKERQRIARDLHDSVTQTLFTATLMSESALMQWEGNPKRSHDLLQDVHHLTRSALAEMRVLLLELRPEALMREPFHKLADQLVTSMQSSSQINYHVDVVTDVEMPFEVKESLYRIMQEGLNNVAKHAQATKVYVALKPMGDGLYMELADNGNGFDADAASAGIGLKSMQERANAIGAKLQVESETNNGTILSVRWKQDDTDEEEDDR